MSDAPPKRGTREYWLYLCVILISLGFLLWSASKADQGSYLHAFGEIAVAFLSAALIGFVLLEIRVEDYERDQKPFIEFWGQPYGDSEPGLLFLQSDSFAHLTRSMITYLTYKVSKELKVQLPEYKPDELLSELCQLQDDDEPTQIKPKMQRAFKARTWINRCDVEGARRIREAFTKLGFTPPAFKTAERLTNLEPFHDGKHPLEIYMGLGYTGDAVDLVNKRCAGFLQIRKTPMGDAISVRTLLTSPFIRNKLYTEEHVDQFDQEFLTLFPEHVDTRRRPWEVVDWIAAHNWNATEKRTDTKERVNAQKETNDYAYILRDVLPNGKKRFHVAGFTEDGTWAAGHYLAKNWRRLYRDYVQGKEHGGRFVVFLYGKSPFCEEAEGQTRQSINKQIVWEEFPESAITPSRLEEKIATAERLGVFWENCKWLDKHTNSEDDERQV